MTEAEKTTQFLKWAKARLNKSFVAECKICKDPSLPFAAVKEHQETNLYYAKHGFWNYKIPDVGYDQKPFDLVQIHMQPAYVVIFWYQQRGDKRMTLIDIDEWMKEKADSKRRSLTYERSCEIGKCEEL